MNSGSDSYYVPYLDNPKISPAIFEAYGAIVHVVLALVLAIVLDLPIMREGAGNWMDHRCPTTGMVIPAAVPR